VKENIFPSLDRESEERDISVSLWDERQELHSAAYF
jgi:hypothetical protein